MLEREKTSVEKERKEKEKLEEKVKHLEEMNEVLSRQTEMMTPLPTTSSFSDRWTPFPVRRQPSGISDDDEDRSETRTTSSSEMDQLMEQRRCIEIQIKQKQEAQRILNDRLRALQSGGSKTCVVQ